MTARKTVLSKEIKAIMARAEEAMDLAFNMFYLLTETIERENRKQERAILNPGVSGEGDS